MIRKADTNIEIDIMSRDEVRNFDSWAINELGMPGIVLMENAGRGCAEVLIEELKKRGAEAVGIFCGIGNNGGDGYVIARHLINCGFVVKTYICGDIGKVKGDAKINLDILRGMGAEVNALDMSGDISDRIRLAGENLDMLVDAVFGTGLKGKLRPGYLKVVEAINDLGKPVLAVDIPSGLDCDTGEPLGAAVKAVCTVTFAALKKGLAIKKTSATYAGEVFIASIGIEPSARDQA